MSHGLSMPGAQSARLFAAGPPVAPPRLCIDELVADVMALIDAMGATKVHLVGHDWGATAAWAVAARAPERLATMTALSVPHPAAFLKAIPTSRQGLASWYMYLFQLPVIPEKWLLGRGGRGFRWFIGDYAGQAPEATERDLRAMMEPGLLSAALNWYRGIPLADFRRPRTRSRCRPCTSGATETRRCWRRVAVTPPVTSTLSTASRFSVGRHTGCPTSAPMPSRIFCWTGSPSHPL